MTLYREFLDYDEVCRTLEIFEGIRDGEYGDVCGLKTINNVIEDLKDNKEVLEYEIEDPLKNNCEGPHRSGKSPELFCLKYYPRTTTHGTSRLLNIFGEYWIWYEMGWRRWRKVSEEKALKMLSEETDS